MPIKPKSHDQRMKALLPKPPEDRPTSAQRGYGARWRKARLAYLRAHPLCVMCAKQGRDEPATELDHIIPHKGDMTLFWDFENNVQSLCRMHHSQKTSTHDGGFGR